MPARASLAVVPLTPDRWADLERLFGPSGADGGCWCMWLRLSAREFSQNGNSGNRRAMRAIVDDGRVPGLLAYLGGEPVGWVSVAPRPEYARLERSPITRRLDETPMWSIVCFFIARDQRRMGVARALLDAAVAYVERRGGEVVEGYPLDPAGETSDAHAWHGTLAMFESAGFAVVAPPRATRPVVRRTIAAPRGSTGEGGGPGMANDEHLAARVRAILAAGDDLAEKQMFGGISFLLAGNICVGVRRDELVVRVAPAEMDDLLARPHVRPFDLTGRPMKGWLIVGAEGISRAADLRRWVRIGAAFAASLPGKR